MTMTIKLLKTLFKFNVNAALLLIGGDGWLVYSAHPNIKKWPTVFVSRQSGEILPNPATLLITDLDVL